MKGQDRKKETKKKKGTGKERVIVAGPEPAKGAKGQEKGGKA